MTNEEQPSGILPGKNLGVVVAGSLTGGVEVKLDAEVSVEDIKVGTFATIQGQRYRFFAVVTDVSLETAEARLRAMPPETPLMAQVVSGTSTFGVIRVLPMLTIGGDALALLEGPQPAKTVPAHFSRATTASEADIELVFGQEDERHFYIGNPLDMETKVCLNLEELVKRSNGVFGKSGTGKTFLTRLLLIGILQKGVASNLVFDMHGEYGWQGSSERGYAVKGLKQLFPSQVAVFSLDEESSRRRGLSPDYLVRIGYQEIEPEDVEMLAGVLNLTPIQTQAVHLIARRLGHGNWLRDFLDLEPGGQLGELASAVNVVEGTVNALHRKLQSLKRMSFLVPQAAEDAVPRILEYLDRGMHVVLEFGRYGNDLAAYILVANLLTRRIHERYVHRTESALGEAREQPRPLVITIEEAHRFLNPGVGEQTIFGTIAREMRKYNVTLLVVDQRPSGIDEEVLSQIGTKITCLLDNERDIDAVLTGVSGRAELRAVLARLESRQQALIFGHAVPMPVVVRTREYGSVESYATLEAFGQQREAWKGAAGGEVRKEDLW